MSIIKRLSQMKREGHHLAPTNRVMKRCQLSAYKMVVNGFVAFGIIISFVGCGTITANKIVGKPDRPIISAEYQSMLMKAGPDVTKAAQNHEWDWQGYADKMEMRAGY